MRSIGWAIRRRADRNAVAWRHCSLGTEGGRVSRAARAPSLDRLFLCASHDKTKPATGSVVQGLGLRAEGLGTFQATADLVPCFKDTWLVCLKRIDCSPSLGFRV